MANTSTNIPGSHCLTSYGKKGLQAQKSMLYYLSNRSNVENRLNNFFEGRLLLARPSSLEAVNSLCTSS